MTVLLSDVVRDQEHHVTSLDSFTRDDSQSDGCPYSESQVWHTVIRRLPGWAPPNRTSQLTDCNIAVVVDIVGSVLLLLLLLKINDFDDPYYCYCCRCQFIVAAAAAVNFLQPVVVAFVGLWLLLLLVLLLLLFVAAGILEAVTSYLMLRIYHCPQCLYCTHVLLPSFKLYFYIILKHTSFKFIKKKVGSVFRFSSGSINECISHDVYYLVVFGDQHVYVHNDKLLRDNKYCEANLTSLTLTVVNPSCVAAGRSAAAHFSVWEASMRLWRLLT